MFTAFLTFFKVPFVRQLLAAAVLSAIASFFTFTTTKNIYVAQGDSRVLKVTEEKNTIRKDFDSYKLSGAERVRSLERDLATQAELAASSNANYQKKLTKAQGEYEAMRKQRKEVAGVLSSAAVDTINTK